MNKKTLFSSIQLIFFACCLFLLPPLAQSQVGTVTLSVGDGLGATGSTDNPVEISLENLDDRSIGVQFDICRGSHLSLSACENTTRTSSISCSSTDLGNGCDRILFFSFIGNFIEKGTGTIINLSYDVTAGAPVGNCQDLTLEGVIVLSCIDDGAGGCNAGPAFGDVDLLPGSFCFLCADDADCDDGVDCTVDSCDQDGNCQYLPDDSLCSNGDFCDGAETCDAIAGCQPGTDPCTPLLCDEGNDRCTNCLNGADCDDGVDCTVDSCDQDGNCQNTSDDALCDDDTFCNGAETCDAVAGCQPGTDPCPDPLLCDEENECYCDADGQCDDGLYCNGEEICLSGECQTGSDPCPGQSCSEDGGCYTPTTTTTITPPPPPPPTTTTTTTTTVVPSYKVTISPSSATLDSDATLQFSAKTTDNGSEVGGSYTWKIVSGSTIGSTIDKDGLFTAGENTTGSDINETVRVTDTDHDNKSATASVTIKFKEQPLPECEVRINPSAATVCSTETIVMEAETTGDEGCLTGDYEWSIDSEIESVIDQEGNYTAGINGTGSDATDVIAVVDNANYDISDSATITVQSKIASVLPDTLLGSRWVPLFYFLLITIEDADFDPGSTISFEPADDILPLGQIVLGKVMIAMVILTANPQEGTVDIIINTGGEIVTGELTIGLLPFIFSEE